MIHSEYGTTLEGLLIGSLTYADDIDVLANPSQELQTQANELYDPLSHLANSSQELQTQPNKFYDATKPFGQLFTRTADAS